MSETLMIVRCNKPNGWKIGRQVRYSMQFYTPPNRSKKTTGGWDHLGHVFTSRAKMLAVVNRMMLAIQSAEGAGKR